MGDGKGETGRDVAAVVMGMGLSGRQVEEDAARESSLLDSPSLLGASKMSNIRRSMTGVSSGGIIIAEEVPIGRRPECGRDALRDTVRWEACAAWRIDEVVAIGNAGCE